MERNQILGIVILVGMLMAYMFIFRDQEPPIQENKANQEQALKDSLKKNLTVKDSLSLNDSTLAKADTTQLDSATIAINDSIKATKANKELVDKYSDFATLTKGNKECVTLSNELVNIKLCSHGGNVARVHLKKYETWLDSALILLDEKSSHMAHVINYKNRNINIDDLYYTTEVDKKNNAVSFTLNLASDKYIKKTYILKENSYELDYNIETKGITDDLKNNIRFEWDNNIKKVEQSLSESQTKTFVNYYTTDEDYDYFNDQRTKLEYNLKWFSHKQRFFNAALIAKESPLEAPQFLFTAFDTKKVKDTVAHINAMVDLNLADISTGKGKYTFYFGPNDYDICKKVTPGFEKNIYLGWALFSWINKWLVIPIFNVLQMVFSNYGIIILFTVIIIKLLLFPLAFKGFKSTAKMKELKPEIEAIKAKHEGNAQQIQVENMKLYKQVGVSPLAGCIPMLLQMPILLSLFNFFPNSIELRHQSFLWAHDLSTYDAPITFPSIPIIGDHISLFCLLMTLSTLAYQYYNTKMNPSATGPMKNIGYIMPIMFFFILNSFSAGLTFYYFVSNLITISQQFIANKFIDKEKIRRTLEENKRNATEDGDGAGKGKKKSKFMQRIEDAQKLAEERKKKK